MSGGSLRTRSAIAGTTVIAVIFTVFSVGLYLVQRSYHENNLSALLDERVLLVEEAAEQRSPAQLAEELDRAAVRANITTSDGQMFATGPPLALAATAGESPPRVATRQVILRDGTLAEVLVVRDGVDRALRNLRIVLAVAVVVGWHWHGQR